MTMMMMKLKFEDLPNEIHFLCLEYFDALELFYSFDGLNGHFNQLIRQIPLYVNFQSIRKSVVDQFCTRLLTDECIQNQIYSLHLSNQNTYGQIEKFLSLFSLHQFPHLQSLHLTAVHEKDVQKLKSMLPFILNLRSFHLLDFVNDVLNVLPLCKLQILSIESLTIPHQMSHITHLTLIRSSFDELIDYSSKYLPVLKYLHVQYIYIPDDRITTELIKAINLKHIVFDLILDEFEYIERFLVATPNLRSLVLSSGYVDASNAQRWEQLIASSLPFLETFRFQFYFYHQGRILQMIDKFNHFQTDFWHQQHQWFTEYTITESLISIYTTPYMTDQYCLSLSDQRFLHDIHAFDKVKILLVDCRSSNDRALFHFSNINSLIIENSMKFHHIQALKSIMNFSNLSDLNISKDCLIETPLILNQIFAEAPQLSSLSINQETLISFFEDKEFCSYLHRRIKKLNLLNNSDELTCTLNNRTKLKKFCQIISKIEHLECKIYLPNDPLYLLDHLKNLSILKIHLITIYDPEVSFLLLRNRIHQYNQIYHLEHRNIGYKFYQTKLHIWTG